MKKRKKSNNFGYYVREGLRGIASHGFMSFAAITIIAACLLITGSFSLVAVNIEYNLSKLMEENEFLAYVDDSLTDDQAMALQTELESIDNVATVTFTSRYQALENYKAEMGTDATQLDNLPDTVLRHRYSIRVQDINNLTETVKAVQDVAGIAKVSVALDVANGFVTVRNVVTIVTIGMVGILLVISLFIVSNAIKLATLSREEEIAIMKMCGATNGFIRLPFVFEGIVLGLASALVGFLCQWGVYTLLIRAIQSASRMQLVALVSFRTLALPMGLVFAGVGLIVGVCGSLITIRKYLQV